MLAQQYSHVLYRARARQHTIGKADSPHDGAECVECGVGGWGGDVFSAANERGALPGRKLHFSTRPWVMARPRSCNLLLIV